MVKLKWRSLGDAANVFVEGSIEPWNVVVSPTITGVRWEVWRSGWGSHEGTARTMREGKQKAAKFLALMIEAHKEKLHARVEKAVQS